MAGRRLDSLRPARTGIAESVRRIAALLGRFGTDGTTLFMAGNLLVNLLRLVSTVTLTRLLSPSDFGAIGVIVSIQFVLVMISDVGFFAYVVRHDERDEGNNRLLDEVWTLRLIRGVALSLLIVLLSPAMAGAIGKPQLTLLIAISGLQLAIEGLSSMAFATGARHGQLGRLALLDLLPAAVQVALSIGLAILLRSYWAIMTATLASAGIKVLLSYLLFPQSARHFRPSIERTRQVWVFGRYIAGSSITQIIVSQTDKLVFARLFSLHQFGLYNLATNLAALPQSVMANYSPRILYPTFAKAHGDPNASLATAYYATGRTMRMLYLLGAGGLVAVAPLLIHLLYGTRYFGAAPYLQLLACAVIFKLPVVAANDLILASGNSAHTLRIGLFRAAWLAASAMLLFTLAGSWGLVVAVVGVEAVSQIYCWVMLGRMKVFRLAQEIRFYAMVPAGYMIGAALNAAGLKLLA